MAVEFGPGNRPSSDGTAQQVVSPVPSRGSSRLHLICLDELH